MSLGRHAFRLRESRAGDPTALSVPASASGLVHRLTGRYTDIGKNKNQMKIKIKNRSKKRIALAFLGISFLGCAATKDKNENREILKLYSTSGVKGLYSKGYSLGWIYSINIEDEDKYVYSTWSDAGNGGLSRGKIEYRGDTITLVPNLNETNGKTDAALPEEYRYRSIICGEQYFLIEESQIKEFTEYVKTGEKLDFNPSFFIREKKEL